MNYIRRKEELMFIWSRFTCVCIMLVCCIYSIFTLHYVYAYNDNSNVCTISEPEPIVAVPMVLKEEKAEPHIKKIEPTEPIVEPVVIEAETLKPAFPSEYANVHTIRDYLKEHGFNDYVIAGIIGNMMIETGGGTLNIQSEIYGGGTYYYGICQWNRDNCAAVHGRDLIGQLDYLMETIEKEFNTFAPAFGTSYEEFCNSNDERWAAITFARVYERCASYGYGVRQNCATTALNYFKEYDSSY